MVYRQDDARRRHTLPLRLGRAGTDAVVEAHPVRCSHFDAFRFFTPDAVGLNRLQPTRATQPAMEQPGCLHANMDLLQVGPQARPGRPGRPAARRFALAREIRTLDMQASPYDVSSLGEPTVAIETPEGRGEYVARQREFAERSAVLRDRLLAVCEVLLGAATARQRPGGRQLRSRPSHPGSRLVADQVRPSTGLTNRLLTVPAAVSISRSCTGLADSGVERAEERRDPVAVPAASRRCAAVPTWPENTSRMFGYRRDEPS